jgi:glyoxylase-like metal-dependent hydrolase (beta-lactamase superfamily II)
MAKLPAHVMTETRWRGPATAAVLGSRGALCLDAPIQPLDADEWIAALRARGATRLAFVVQMDSSPERAMAVANLRALPQAGSLTVVAHQHTAEVMRAVPDSLRTGAVLATLGAGFQGGEFALPPWVRPQVTFTESLTFHWDKTAVELVHMPGANPGALWVHLPQERLLFVGDALATDMPPYLGEADLPTWLEALARLRRAPFKGMRLFCSRGGWVSAEQVTRFAAFLRAVQHRLESLKSKSEPQKDLTRAAASLSAYFRFPRERRPMVESRLRLGLQALWEREHGPLPARDSGS